MRPPLAHPLKPEDILKRIEAHLHQSGGRLTALRREIALAMAKMKEPKTAYQLLALINKKRAKNLSAISLYRTLDFLMDAGLVLKLESKNAYELCLHEAHDHSHVMMVCDKCGQVREIDDQALSKILSTAARKHGHKLKHHAIELHGVCKAC